MTQEKPEDRKATAPEEPKQEVLENQEKFREGLNCPCFGEQPRKKNPRMIEPWINFEL